MAFTYVGSVSLSAGSESTNLLIPKDGKPTIALITNIGGRLVFVLPGVGKGLTAVVGVGISITPGGQVELNIGANTHLAFITFSGETDLNIVLGT